MFDDMGVRIKQITGATGFFRPGDEIVSIDGIGIDDQLDLIFNLPDHGSVEFRVLRTGGREVRRRLRADTFGRAGLVFEEMAFARCRSRCIFCFVDQMPAGLRPSLYEKDDDYRLSFLFGNFITLNDLSERDIERIEEMRLSPLYVSVHAVDDRVRRELFGRGSRHRILDLLERLSGSGITIHAQVVLVPGINDGDVLEETVGELYRFYPGCRSLAVVPVGLTAHRKGLVHVDPVTPGMARDLVRWAREKRKGFRSDSGSESFLHLADEFYLQAGETFPPSDEYDGYPQMANGVGMCRSFMDEFERDLENLAGVALKPLSIGVVTGRLGERFLSTYIVPMVKERLPDVEIVLIPVVNELFGEQVGVSGLISGRDIIKAVRDLRSSVDCIAIPANALNHQGRFVDDTTPADISRETGAAICVAEGTFLGKDVLGSIGGAPLP